MARSTTPLSSEPSPIDSAVFDIHYTDSSDGSRIRRIDGFTAVVTTRAGLQGSSGFNGDGIPAVLAELKNPTGLTAFYKGATLLLYTSDMLNRRVRRFAP